MKSFTLFCVRAVQVWYKECFCLGDRNVCPIEKSFAQQEKKLEASLVIRHDWNFKWDWLLWSDETKNVVFLAANTQDGFGEHRDKKYPMCTMTYTSVFSYVVGLCFCWRSWTSCLDTRHHWFYQIPTDKQINKWLTLLEILSWAMFGSSNCTIIIS